MIRGDAIRLPLRSASVDVATVAFGIRNTEAPAAVFAEVHRVLRDNGRLVILEFGIPTVPLVRWVYLGYFRRILPQIGSVISGHRRAYCYLPESVAAFASPDEIASALGGSGFSVSAPVRMALGIVYLCVAEKVGG
jgi:demethylmenaquinone methyltransferase/2-methoxy-6-polyprenyl-1,4-benzoquinol methylase